MMHFLLFMSIGLATLSLALAYGLNVSVALGLAIAAFGCLWVIGARLDWHWTAPLSFALFIGAAAFGIWLGLPTDGLLVAVVIVLIAWDLDHFAQRRRAAEGIEGESVLKRAHLQRLLIITGLSLLLGEIALRVKLSLAFGWTLLLGLLTVVGLSAAIRFLRRESD